MNLFLQNEEEDKRLARALQIKSRSLLKRKFFMQKRHCLEELDEFIVSETPSEAFIHIALANINYNYYSRKELYVSSKKTANDHKDTQYPENFFTYRDSIELNDNTLKNYYTYYQFINRYLDNLAYHGHTKKATNFFNKVSYCHQTQKLKLIDSLITNKQLHDNLLTKYR